MLRPILPGGSLTDLIRLTRAPLPVAAAAGAAEAGGVGPPHTPSCACQQYRGQEGQRSHSIARPDTHTMCIYYQVLVDLSTRAPDQARKKGDRVFGSWQLDAMNTCD